MNDRRLIIILNTKKFLISNGVSTAENRRIMVEPFPRVEKGALYILMPFVTMY